MWPCKGQGARYRQYKRSRSRKRHQQQSTSRQDNRNPQRLCKVLGQLSTPCRNFQPCK